MHGKRILLGVTGGIAAYKSADLVRRLIEQGAQVQVVMTAAAREFVTPTTFQALSGRTVRTSVDRGFQSAWRTVLAADLVSFAAAAVLFILAIGEVKGFAFFLGLSTLLDVFMTYFFTRPLVVLLGRNDRLTSGRFGVSRGLAMAAVER